MTIDERIEFLLQSNESHNQQIGELAGQVNTLARHLDTLTGNMSTLAASMSKLVDVSNEDATAIRTLARIAEAHEKRISQLEEGGSLQS